MSNYEYNEPLIDKSGEMIRGRVYISSPDPTVFSIKNTKQQLLQEIEHQKICNETWQLTVKRLEETIDRIRDIDHKKWVEKTLPELCDLVEENTKLKEKIDKLINELDDLKEAFGILE